MYKEIDILKYFFEDPLEEFHIREIARLTNLNQMTIRKYLNNFVDEKLLLKKKTKLYDVFVANYENKKFINLKLFCNLERLRESNIIKDLEQFYDCPAIILFGSYATASNVKGSDIDICVVTDIKKDFSGEKYESKLNRKVDLHRFGVNEFKKMKETNPELINNVLRGIWLSGILYI